MNRPLAATLCTVLLLGTPLLATADVPEPTTGNFELVPIPQPSLDGMEDDVRQQIEGNRAAIDQLRRQSGAGVELGRALGELGALYLLYNLYEPAYAAFTNAAVLDPEQIRWPYLLAFVDKAEGRLDAAAAGFRRALALEPDHLVSLIGLGETRIAQGRPADAVEPLTRAVELRRTCAACHYGLGLAAVAQGDPRTAIEHFTETLRLQPAATAVHYPLGQAWRDVGDVERAQAELAEAGDGEVQKPDPILAWVRGLGTGASLHFARGRRALSAGQLDVAVAELRQATAADPENVAIRRALGLALRRSGDGEAAVGEYFEAMRLEPANPLNHQDLALALMDQGRPREAAVAFARAVDLDPGFADAHLGLGIALARLGRPREALPHLDRAVALAPENGDAVFERAMTLTTVGRGAEAVAALAALVEREPDRLMARLNLGTLLELAGETEAARRQLDAVLAADAPPEPAARAHLTLGRLDEEAGDRAAAERRYRQALALLPRLPPARLRLASVEAAKGDYLAAAANYAELLTAVPAHREARIAHSTCLLLTGRAADAAASLESGLSSLREDPYLQHQLAVVRATAPEAGVRKGEQAVELARAAYAAMPGPGTGQAVAMAYAEAGRFEEAVRAQERLLGTLPPGDEGRAGAEARLREYRAGRALREPWKEDPSLLYSPVVPLQLGN